MLRKKPAGRATMDRRQEVTVLRMGKPFDAFSMIALLVLAFVIEVSRLTYRSITVIRGQVKPPAVTALATSTPSRWPNRLVFHD